MLEITITLTDDDSQEVISTITLTKEESQAVISYAADERRDPAAQAAVFISEAVDCWHAKPSKKSAAPVKRLRHKQVATNGAVGAEL